MEQLLPWHMATHRQAAQWRETKRKMAFGYASAHRDSSNSIQQLSMFRVSILYKDANSSRITFKRYQVASLHKIDMLPQND